MVQDVGLDETVAIIILNVDISGQAQEKLKICLPGNLLTVIFHSIDDRKHLARGFSYQDNKEKISWIISVTPNCLLQDSLVQVQLDLKGLYQIQWRCDRSWKAKRQSGQAFCRTSALVYRTNGML